MKIYLLYYDYDDSGDRENWSTFYTPVEIFTSAEMRLRRINFIKSINTSLQFHTSDEEIMTAEMLFNNTAGLKDDEDEDDEDEDEDF